MIVVDPNDTHYPFKGQLGEAWKDLSVLVNTAKLNDYPLFWREFATQLYADVIAMLVEKDLKIAELEGET